MTRGKVNYAMRSAARLAAVQALYQMDLIGASADVALRDQMQHVPDTDAGDVAQSAFDPAMLGDIVRGVTARRGDIDEMLSAVLVEGWTLDRLEVVLRAILRAGIWELLVRTDIDAPVIINEYVNIAKDFFSGSEPKLVNGMLDRLASTLRPAQTGAARRDRHDKNG